MRTCEIAWAKALKPVQWYRCLGCHRCFQTSESTKLHTCDRVGLQANESSKDSGIGIDEEANGSSEIPIKKVKQEPVEVAAHEANEEIYSAKAQETTNNTANHSLINLKQEPSYIENDYQDQFKSPQNSREVRGLSVQSKPREKYYPCYFCFKPFLARNMGVHLRTHTKERPCICSTCGRGFGRTNQLKTHIRKMHSLKMFPLPNLNDSIRTKNQMKKADGPNSCYFCGKSFSSFSVLTRHLSSHTKEII